MEKKNNIQIEATDGDITLKTIDSSDIESIRIWKNKYRDHFFYNRIITKAVQAKWYNKYLKRFDDYIFMILYNDLKIGCIGFRKIEENIDIYNVILGREEYGKSGIMGKALRILCTYISDNLDNNICAKVLKSNPARSWYIKNGFFEVEDNKDYLLLKLDINNFVYIKYNLMID